MKLRLFFHRYGNSAIGCGLSIHRLWRGGTLPVWKHFNLALGWPIKTGAFFRCIYYVNDTRSVVVDQHIIAAAGMEDLFVQSARWCYDLIADCIRQIADSVGLLPGQAQAIIWLTWKDLKGEVEDEIPF